LNVNQLNLTDAGLKSLAQIRNLNRLFASHTKITNAGLKIIRHLPIRVLHIESSGITNEGMKNMPGIEVIDEKTQKTTSTLASLYLGSCRLNVEGLESIRSAPLSELMVVGSTDFDDECVEFIVKTWPNIKMLLMDDTAVTKNSIKNLSSLKHLEQLGIASLGLSDDDILPILKLPKLNTLNVGSNKITDVTLQRLHLCPTLSRLDVTYCNEISPDMLKRAQQKSGIKFTCPIQTIESQGSVKEITDLMVQ
jgi:hypothetical protein